MPDKTKQFITISRTEYESLKKSELKWNLLDCGGVDNWEWYGEALSSYNEEEEELLKDLNSLSYSDSEEIKK